MEELDVEKAGIGSTEGRLQIPPIDRKLLSRLMDELMEKGTNLSPTSNPLVSAEFIFASIAAHTTAVLPVLLATAMSVPGVPVKPMAMLLCFSLGIMGVITPYATGPSPIYYGSGYITRTAYWSLGLVFGIYFLAVLLLIGVPYMNILYP